VRAPLDVFFKPRRVAIIGATDKPHTVGRALLSNLKESWPKDQVLPVNPRHDSLLGLRCYRNIAEAGKNIDLAVIATPAQTVPHLIGECAAAGVGGAIVISAGFRETGAAGVALEQEITARRGSMRIIGPNCVGLMNPHNGLNASFASSIAIPGSVGFISQSGALCTAILDWSRREMVGFSAFVSIGSMLDVGWGDLIQYLGDDPATHSIVIYMESVGDAGAFLSAAREVALSKPIIVIKPGRTEAGARAATSHTGALTGSDEVLDAAFRRCGVLRVNTIAELFYLSEALGKQPRPSGPRLAIVTNAGGPGVLATDALLSQGGKLADLSQSTMDGLNLCLPPHWSHHNPVDIIGDAGPERYSKAVELVAYDSNVDGLLVILAPQAVTDSTTIAQQLKPYAHLEGKPVLASWMGGLDVALGASILNSSGIPTYAYPDAAAQVFHSMWRYSENLRALYETPQAIEEPGESFAGGHPQDLAKAAAILDEARAKRRTILTEAESKQLLEAYGIPTVQTVIATSEAEAVEHAISIGYPVVLKLHSETVTHKTDAGGVKLNLRDEASVREAYRGIERGVAGADFLGVTVQPMVTPLVNGEGYELILGSSIDAQFGPVLLFGGGGLLVEVMQDHALGLPPLNTTLARRMMERTKIFTALGGVRGRRPVDLKGLEEILVRFSSLVAGQPWIQEIDINPLLASSDRLIVLDARVVLHPANTPEANLPKVAIRPYPIQYAKPWHFEDGEEVMIRPIRPEDEPLMIRFHSALSEQSVYLRYFHLMDLDRRVAHDRLIRICFADYDRNMVLVAERRNAATKEREILAVARLSKNRAGDEAEFAVLITDEFQGRGLGTEMVNRLLETGRAEKLSAITADILGENLQMLRVCKLLGFELEFSQDDGVVKARLSLTETPPA